MASSRMLQRFASVVVGVGLVTIFCSLLAMSKVRHQSLVYRSHNNGDGATDVMGSLAAGGTAATNSLVEKVRVYVSGTCDGCPHDPEDSANRTYVDIGVLEQAYRNGTLYISTNKTGMLVPVPLLHPQVRVPKPGSSDGGAPNSHVSPARETPLLDSSLSNNYNASEGGVCSPTFRQAFVRRQCASTQRAAKATGGSVTQSFIYELKHSLAYCIIYKCSSTTVIHMLNAANGGPNKEQLEGLQRRNPIANSVHTLPKSHRKGLSQKKIPLHATAEFEKLDKFLIVRHPFDRLASCYLDKVAKNHDRYFRSLRAVIWNNYSPLKNRTVRSGIRDRPSKVVLARDTYTTQLVTFPMFLQFLVDYNRNPRDRTKWRMVEGGHVAHFNLYADHCHHCQVDFQHVLRTETLNHDLAPILHKLNLPEDFLGGLNFNQFQKRDDRSSIVEGYTLELFRTIPRELLDKLYSIYHSDFETFGYTFDLRTRVAGCRMYDSNGVSCC